MANPQDSGTFENWITDRIGFVVVPPKSGDTGDFEKTITDRLFFVEYQEAAAVFVPELPKVIEQAVNRASTY